MSKGLNLEREEDSIKRKTERATTKNAIKKSEKLLTGTAKDNWIEDFQLTNPRQGWINLLINLDRV